MVRSIAACLILSLMIAPLAAQQPATPGTPAPATPAAQPPKLPADLAKPRSQLQAEFAVAAGDTVLFAYQSKELTKRSAKILEGQATWLKQHAGLAITLEAYCDDDLPAEQTQALCQERGNIVKTELVRLGIAADRFRIAAFIDPPGRKSGGATSGGRKDDDKNRRNNRRVMTRIDG